MARIWGLEGREDGQGLVEYGLIIVLVALVVIGALVLLGEKVSALFTTIAPSV